MNKNSKTLGNRLEQLKKLDDEINQKKSKLKSADCRKDKVMQLLHEYNDIKDATQVVLGALANVEGVTVKTLHEKYNLPLDS